MAKVLTPDAPAAYPATCFIIGVVQDSAETALNSATDVRFTAACIAAGDAEESAPQLARQNG